MDEIRKQLKPIRTISDYIERYPKRDTFYLTDETGSYEIPRFIMEMPEISKLALGDEFSIYPLQEPVIKDGDKLTVAIMDLYQRRFTVSLASINREDRDRISKKSEIMKFYEPIFMEILNLKNILHF